MGMLAVCSRFSVDSSLNTRWTRQFCDELIKLWWNGLDKVPRVWSISLLRAILIFWRIRKTKKESNVFEHKSNCHIIMFIASRSWSSSWKSGLLNILVWYLCEETNAREITKTAEPFVGLSQNSKWVPVELCARSPVLFLFFRRDQETLMWRNLIRPSQG